MAWPGAQKRKWDDMTPPEQLDAVRSLLIHEATLSCQSTHDQYPLRSEAPAIGEQELDFRRRRFGRIASAIAKDEAFLADRTEIETPRAERWAEAIPVQLARQAPPPSGC